MEYIALILVLICIYCILSLSLDLLVGHLGLLSMAQAGIAGIGSYCTGIIAIEQGFPFLLTVPLVAGATSALSVLVSIPTLRLHDDYYAIGTFGCQVILFSIFNNWIAITNGPLGLPNIPHPRILAWMVDTTSEYLILTSSILAICCLLVHLITNSPLGRVLHAIREDEVLAKSMGHNVVSIKVGIAALSAALAAMAGSLYAHFVTFVHPSNFSVTESILVLSMVILGGAASIRGPIIGASVLIVLPEILRSVGIPSSIAANVREIVYGIALVMMMAWRPHGLVGRYSFR